MREKKVLPLRVLVIRRKDMPRTVGELLAMVLAFEKAHK